MACCKQLQSLHNIDLTIYCYMASNLDILGMNKYTNKYEYMYRMNKKINYS